MSFAKLPISRVADVELGKMLKTSPSDGDVLMPYLRAAHVQPGGRLIDLGDEQSMYFSPKEAAALTLKAGDMVVVEGGAGYGRSAVLERDYDGWAFQNSILRVRPRPGRADARFLSYALRTALDCGEIDLFVNTATIPHFTAEKVSRFVLPMPAAEQQGRIADYLDRETATIDALIEKQSELIRLSKMRRVLMIDAVLEESWSSSPLTSIKSLTRTHGLVDGDWVESKDQDPEGRVRLTQLADVGDGFFRDRSDRWVNDETFDRLRCFALNAGDILIARMPDPIGRACVVPALPYRAITVVDVAILRPVGHADSRYLAYVLNGSRVRGAFESLQDGATRQRITRKNLDRTFVPLPSLEQQREIADHLDRETAKIDALIAKAERFIELAQERRAALITAAVTGQIEIPTED
ncbi:restriction endonuclease subunit S [Micrococcus sp. SL257]|uniref:restriction endonuclease subunit S n=1 Tax=Micrococcus sp. SL257 TaxID=2995171 RepID=UPI00226F8900|nr:restriction endonuclease subunit S [Micrococcus sp. SL257]WAC17194.1 restriction endonuclease subunit S [Micrococcus sp. SL257]